MQCFQTIKPENSTKILDQVMIPVSDGKHIIEIVIRTMSKMREVIPIIPIIIDKVRRIIEEDFISGTLITGHKVEALDQNIKILMNTTLDIDNTHKKDIDNT